MRGLLAALAGGLLQVKRIMETPSARLSGLMPGPETMESASARVQQLIDTGICEGSLTFALKDYPMTYELARVKKHYRARGYLLFVTFDEGRQRWTFAWSLL